MQKSVERGIKDATKNTRTAKGRKRAKKNTRNEMIPVLASSPGETIVMALRGLGSSRLSKSLVDGDRTGNVVLSAKSMQIENIVQSAIGMEFKRNSRNRSPGNGHLKSSSRCVTPEIQLNSSENPSKIPISTITNGL